MKKPMHHLIAEVPRSITKVGMTIGIDLGDVWSHYGTLNEDGEVVDRGRFRTTLSGVEKWFTDVPRARVAMEAETHSIWVSEQLRELGHEVIVANVRELINCPANDCTIGYGHLVHKGPVCGAASEAPFVLGISEQQGTALLLEGCVVRGACRRAYGDGTVRYASLPFVKSLIVMN